jgi:hypothetical protein
VPPGKGWNEEIPVQSDAPGGARAEARQAARGRRPLVTLGALTAALLLTAACEETKGFACKSSATIDGLFGTEASTERSQDCGPQAGQAARAPDAKATTDAKAATGAKHAARPAGPQSDPETVAALQTRLKDLGYDPGPPDGQLGPRTRAAIRAYQKTEGLEADGQVTASLLEHIRAE